MTLSNVTAHVVTSKYNHFIHRLQITCSWMDMCKIEDFLNNLSQSLHEMLFCLIRFVSNRNDDYTFGGEIPSLSLSKGCSQK